MAKPATFTFEEDRGCFKTYFKGKKYRAPKGMNKKDLPAWWTLRLAKLENVERDAKRQHREDVLNEFPDYRVCIDGWYRVKAWCERNDDGTRAAVAGAKIDYLYEQIDGTDLNSDKEADWPDQLTTDDYFPATLPRDVLASEEYSSCISHYDGIDTLADLGAARYADEQWRQRLAADEKRVEHQQAAEAAVESRLTLQGNIDAFVDIKRSEVTAGELTGARLNFIVRHLEILVEYAPVGMKVADLDGAFVNGFRLWLLAEERNFRRRYASDVFNTFKQLVRWLVNIAGQLPALPKNLDDRQQRIKVPTKQVEILTEEHVSAALAAANDRMRLYLLLGLNCAMTQKDISDLKLSEVDFKAGRITRKRPKTKGEANVPTVTYQLWPETLTLLKKFRSDSSERVLLTSNGSELVRRGEKSNGQAESVDTVALAFRTLKKKSGVDCKMLDFRKYACSLIRSQERFNGLESLFLGHAPTSMAEGHYTAVPQDLLDAALEWLGTELGITKVTPEK